MRTEAPHNRVSVDRTSEELHDVDRRQICVLNEVRHGRR